MPVGAELAAKTRGATYQFPNNSADADLLRLAARVRLAGVLHCEEAQLRPPVQEEAVRENGVRLRKVAVDELLDLWQLLLPGVRDDRDPRARGRLRRRPHPRRAGGGAAVRAHYAWSEPAGRRQRLAVFGWLRLGT